MQVGVVNMYGTNYGCRYLIHALLVLKCVPYVIDGFHNTTDVVYKSIISSPIKYWIFSGSAHDVLDTHSPQVPNKLFSLKNKRFMMLCYSMESSLIQLNLKLVKRPTHKKEIIHIDIPKLYNPLFENIKNPMVVRRNHMCYFDAKTIKAPVKLLASYNDEAMIAEYGNTTFIQFHPEKSSDGKKLIVNWLNIV